MMCTLSGIEDLASVLEELGKIAYKWKRLGDFLNLHYGDMEMIGQDKGGSTECMREIIASWLKGNGRRPVTWQTIIDALYQIEEPELANSVKAKI